MTTEFFKIILTTQPRLRLPPKFVNKYKVKESMPRLVSLGDPNGTAFQVELTSSDGEIWLDKGFGQFMDYYKIQRGYLVFFESNFVSSFFHVKIFDERAVEIEYPLTSSNGKHPEEVSDKPCSPREETNVVSGKCIDMLGERPRKQKKSEGKKLVEAASDVSGKRATKNLEKVKTYEKRGQTVSVMKTAHERAKSFISTRPSFVSFIHHSYITHSLHIKKSLAMELFKVKSACDVVLMVNGDTRTWTAKCIMESQHAKLRWRAFVKDNGLCEGDSCVFELGNTLVPCLNVIIFRSSEYGEVNGNLRNTNVDEISRKQKVSEGKEFDDVSVKILEKGSDYEDSAHFIKESSAKESARKVRKKDIEEEKEEESRDEPEENKEEKDEGSEAGYELEKEEMKKASAKTRNLVKGKKQPKGGKSVRDDELRDGICDILKVVDSTDILKQLSKRFDTDLAPRKSCIELMIKEELLKLG